MYFVENAMGQVIGAPIDAFNRIHPKLKGIAFTGCIIAFLTSVYYIVLLAWTFIFLIYSL